MVYLNFLALHSLPPPQKKNRRKVFLWIQHNLIFRYYNTEVIIRDFSMKNYFYVGGSVVRVSGRLGCLKWCYGRLVRKL